MRKFFINHPHSLLRFMLYLLVSLSAKGISAHNEVQTGTLQNDLILVKPLINMNYPDGGYYSEYYDDAFNYLSCGAVIQNAGTSISTHIYLEIKFLDYLNNVISTYSSDSTSSILANETDTIYIPAITSIINNGYRMIFEIKGDSAEGNLSNNVDTIPCTQFFYPMWSYVSRANILTNSLDITWINNFNSGDFIGVTLKVPNYCLHFPMYLEVYMTQAWPDSLELIGKVYKNGILLAVDSTFGHNLIPGWTYTQIGLFPWEMIEKDSLYYFGVEIKCPGGTNVPIGIDTSSFHNFNAESVARIGSTWTSLDFIPLIRLVCDPEGINENDGIDQLLAFPNPSTGRIHVILPPQFGKPKAMEVFDCTGQLQLTQKERFVDIDMSNLKSGIYFIMVTNTNNERQAIKIIKE